MALVDSDVNDDGHKKDDDDALEPIKGRAIDDEYDGEWVFADELGPGTGPPRYDDGGEPTDFSTGMSY